MGGGESTSLSGTTRASRPGTFHGEMRTPFAGVFCPSLSASHPPSLRLLWVQEARGTPIYSRISTFPDQATTHEISNGVSINFVLAKPPFSVLHRSLLTTTGQIGPFPRLPCFILLATHLRFQLQSIDNAPVSRLSVRTVGSAWPQQCRALTNSPPLPSPSSISSHGRGRSDIVAILGLTIQIADNVRADKPF
ncbi:hypothetical protein KSP40_PGU005073 [Platanthera guangdongensis]|uniref:Uncharacterized protein n=1 Tax=Platanthera guangdongensis TaxID=2320717 RepID=A0ABR2M798_9ASPA